jgi:hypothetical protein
MVGTSNLGSWNGDWFRWSPGKSCKYIIYLAHWAWNMQHKAVPVSSTRHVEGSSPPAATTTSLKRGANGIRLAIGKATWAYPGHVAASPSATALIFRRKLSQDMTAPAQCRRNPWIDLDSKCQNTNSPGQGISIIGVAFFLYIISLTWCLGSRE